MNFCDFIKSYDCISEFIAVYTEYYNEFILICNNRRMYGFLSAAQRFMFNNSEYMNVIISDKINQIRDCKKNNVKSEYFYKIIELCKI